MEDFKNLYPLNKTLRFSLKPYGKTLEKIKESELLEKDKYKADVRHDMQRIIDEKYKKIIEERLSNAKLDVNILSKVSSKEKSEKEEAISNLKKQIKLAFNGVPFEEGKFISKLIEEQPNNEIINIFNKFSTYFTNFFDIREHVFTGDSAGSIAYRLIDDNLNIFLNNIDKIKKYPEDLLDMLKDLDKISKIENYNLFLTQTGITKYNEILGGVSIKGDSKLQGINEQVNLYCQKNKVKLPRLSQLYKMILSDKVSSSFVLDIIENDKELIEMVNVLITKVDISKSIELSGSKNIYIKYSQLGNLPQIPYHIISSAFNEKYDLLYGDGKRKKSYELDRRKYIESNKYSIESISELLPDENVVEKIINRYKELIDAYNEAKDNYLKIDWHIIENIKQSNQKKHIKELLDTLKAIQRFYNLFEVVEENHSPNIDFYLWLSVNSIQLGSEFNEVYNKTRNYLTKKQYSIEKFKLNFDNPQLANGWDTNKEKDNSAFILRKFNDKRKDYDYFLGIWEKNTSRKDKETSKDNNGIFEKMQYKLYPDPSKMMPKQFMSKTWKEQFPITEEFEEKYKQGCHKKGESFDKRFLYELIDRFKHGLVNHEEKYQDMYDFKLKNTKEYNEYTEFIRDVTRSNYKLTFEKISDISDLIDEGKLFVFQIFSKDFSEYSKGTKNLNTIYFETIFSDENLKDPVFKLSGGAELFYRPASLKYDKEIIEKGHHYEDLKDKFSYPIIKDRRYSEDKYFFHVPMVINFNSENLGPRALNEKVNSNLDNFKHIIGIDRGERHLIYISVVEIETGKIVEQMHLDEIVNLDTKGKEHKTSYLKKLEEKSKTREEERKSWETIETIKELKEGYISQVVNEIRNLQEKYNALIVMENLNYGFKNSRIKVEKQIYQKFETALIKKFNYVIEKNETKTYINGKQLTNPITTLDKIGSQSGIVIYIPAWNTSKIDPITGFVNLFYADDLRYKNKEQVEGFIRKIDRIYFEDGVFKFQIDYSKWNNRYEGSKTKWTLTSYGNRIHSFRNIKKNNQWDYEEINLTEKFKDILNLDGTIKSEEPKNYKEFLHLFKLMVSMRNSVTGTDIDYMISPVSNDVGINFDSRKCGSNLPKDADANGAYNIARKGLMVIDNISSGVKDPFKISNEDYLKFIQK